METCSLKDLGLEKCCARAAAVLRSGGVVIYPTDTLYALGADALSDEAVQKIYDIKGREELKPIHAIVADAQMAERYGELHDEAHLILKNVPTGTLTLIVRKKELNAGITRGIDTFGFRIPDNDFCKMLATVFDGPITATSANKSGHKPERKVGRILAQLGKEAALVDVVIDAGELPLRQPSTVVDMTKDRPLIIREGAIAASDFWNAIREEQSE